MTDLANRQLHEDNRLSWNAATVAHNSHKHDQAGYFRRGGCKLYPQERELLGDVRGLDIVHLQCNCDQDTLSIATLTRSAHKSRRRRPTHPGGRM
jgi:hypothetical protein